MKAVIHPSRLKGTIRAPASKSSMQRACAAALLAAGTHRIHNPGQSNDDQAALEIIQQLGAALQISKEEIIVTSPGYPASIDLLKGTPSPEPQPHINGGESGLSIRMFTPIAALSHREILISGKGSLLNRPMDFFDTILPELGVKIKSSQGKLPIQVQGPLQPATIEMDGSLSSQFLTGLLMAYAAAGASDVSIRVRDLKSRPYIDLTLDVMKRFGLKLPLNRNYREFYFDSSTPPAGLTSHDYSVERDWSSAAFLLVAGAIAGPVTLLGMDLSSAQADKAILNALMDAHSGIAIDAKGIKIRPAEMNAFDFDATDCPDLFPPLVALAAYCKGETKIKGVGRLRHKESNRALTLQDEFAKMGVVIKWEEDEMRIYGTGKLNGARVHSRQDHRIAMACAVAALGANGETSIDEAGAVNKSYPGFYEDLKKLNADVSLDNKLKWHE